MLRVTTTGFAIFTVLVTSSAARAQTAAELPTTTESAPAPPPDQQPTDEPSPTFKPPAPPSAERIGDSPLSKQSSTDHKSDSPPTAQASTKPADNPRSSSGSSRALAQSPTAPCCGPSQPRRIEAPQTFRLSGLSQIEYLKRDISCDELSDASRVSLNEDRLGVRRARLYAESDWGLIGLVGQVELFSGGRTAEPVQYEARIQKRGRDPKAPSFVRLSAGLMPVPFGYELYEQTHRQRFFGERTLLAEAFVPGRFDLGVAVNGHIATIDWIVALMNGEPIGAGRFAYTDPNGAKDVAGRVRTSGRLFPTVFAALGVSAIRGTGFSAGTAPTKNTFEWRDLNEDGRVLPSELIPIPGSAGRPSQNFERWGAGVDAQLSVDLPDVGPLFIYGEVAVGVNIDRGVAPADPVLLGRDQRSLGFYAAVTQSLYDKATVGVRYDHYEPNRDALELFDGTTVVTRRRFRTLSVGASADFHLSDGVMARLLTEYQYQDNELGRDNRGRPAQLDNDTFRLRMQVVF